MDDQQSRQEALDYFNEVTRELANREKLLEEITSDIKALKAKLEETAVRKLPRVLQAADLPEKEAAAKQLRRRIAVVNEKLKTAEADVLKAKERLEESKEELTAFGIRW